MIKMEKKESERPVVKNDSVAPTMAKTEQTIDKSRRVCTLSHAMIEMLVKQLGAELSNHNLYRTFANYFSCQGLPKLEEYFILRADEEDNHHNWILWYLNYNDAEFQYPRIEAINVDIPNRAYPFEATVDREIETTESINKIVKQAIQEGDWATEAWLKGNDDEHGKLVLEQIEEESISRTIAEMANEDTDWQTKQDTILSFYLDYPGRSPNDD